MSRGLHSISCSVPLTVLLSGFLILVVSHCVTWHWQEITGGNLRELSSAVDTALKQSDAESADIHGIRLLAKDATIANLITGYCIRAAWVADAVVLIGIAVLLRQLRGHKETR